MKQTNDYVAEAWASARQFADPGNEMNYVIGYLRGVIRMMEEANAGGFDIHDYICGIMKEVNDENIGTL